MESDTERKPLTNGELAEYFNKQPVDQSTSIYVIDGDSSTISEEWVFITAPEDVEGRDPGAVGRPLIYYEY